MVKVHSNHSRKQPNRAMKTEVIIIPMIGPFSFILIGECTIGLFMKNMVQSLGNGRLHVDVCKVEEDDLRAILHLTINSNFIVFLRKKLTDHAGLPR